MVMIMMKMTMMMTILMNKTKMFIDWLEKNKIKGDIFPGAFDFIDLWNLNSTRCGGHFNKIFFPLYLYFFLYAIPYTIFCFMESII